MDEQALLDQEVDQRAAFGGDFRVAGDAAARAAGVGIDAGKPGDKAASQQSKTRLPVARDLRVASAALQGALDGGLDRALDAAKLLILRKLEIAVAALLAIKPLQGEGEQRQRVLGAAFLDVGEQRIDQGLFDLERPLGAFEPPRRTLDDLGIGAFRHGRQVKGCWRRPCKLLGRLAAARSCRSGW